MAHQCWGLFNMDTMSEVAGVAWAYSYFLLSLAFLVQGTEAISVAALKLSGAQVSTGTPPPSLFPPTGTGMLVWHPHGGHGMSWAT